MIEGVEVRAGDDASRCPFCHGALEAGSPRWTCPACAAAHHVECHGEAGGRCASCRAPTDGRAIEVRPVSANAHCPFCHGALEKADATWTCERCAAVHHEDCLRAVGGQCVSCRAPFRARPGAAIAPRPRWAARDPSIAMSEGMLVQAAGLALAGLIGLVAGGQNGLIAAALACVAGILITGVRAAGQEGWIFGTLHVLITAPIFGLIPVLIDALDVSRRKPSGTMLGLCLLSAALSAAVGRWFRRA